MKSHLSYFLYFHFSPRLFTEIDPYKTKLRLIKLLKIKKKVGNVLVLVTQGGNPIKKNYNSKRLNSS